MINIVPDEFDDEDKIFYIIMSSILGMFFLRKQNIFFYCVCH